MGGCPIDHAQRANVQSRISRAQPPSAETRSPTPAPVDRRRARFRQNSACPVRYHRRPSRSYPQRRIRRLSDSSLTFTATVSPASATGTVAFYQAPSGTNGWRTLGSAPVSAGIASLTQSSSTVGVQNIYSAYLGDTSDTGSTSSQISQTLNQAATTTTLTSHARGRRRWAIMERRSSSSLGRDGPGCWRAAGPPSRRRRKEPPTANANTDSSPVDHNGRPGVPWLMTLLSAIVKLTSAAGSG